MVSMFDDPTCTVMGRYEGSVAEYRDQVFLVRRDPNFEGRFELVSLYSATVLSNVRPASFEVIQVVRAQPVPA